MGKSELGQSGEDLVAEWLSSQGWRILGRRWRWRLGEIDLIAQQVNPALIAFVEVKTRRSGNWDLGGALAVTRSKQRKIILTAQHFLNAHPHLAEWPCRFDVALVKTGREGLSLGEYLPGAFEGEEL
ncbi:MAG: YraN family protein [Cyanobacteria bacterium RI_101]|nr:YraN family protein [Cyanobacteria bacterium RI_101]